jgi:hypothetical protein
MYVLEWMLYQGHQAQRCVSVCITQVPVCGRSNNRHNNFNCVTAPGNNFFTALYISIIIIMCYSFNNNEAHAHMPHDDDDDGLHVLMS